MTISGLNAASAQTYNSPNNTSQNIKSPELGEPENIKPIFCTQDAKLCPDGSYVGRTGPNCEFAQCPQPSKMPATTTPSIIVIPIGQPDTGNTTSKPTNPSSVVAEKILFKVNGRAVSISPVPATNSNTLNASSTETKKIIFNLVCRGCTAESVPEVTLQGLQFEQTKEKAGAPLKIHITVLGDRVRSWSEEVKDTVRARLEQIDELNNYNDFGMFIASQALENKRLRGIEISPEFNGRCDSVVINYDTEIRILGLWKKTVTAKAKVTNQDCEGVTENKREETGITYQNVPQWLKMLSLEDKTLDDEMIRLANLLKTKHDTVKNSISNIR